MPKANDYNEIINSHYNGQGKQMLDQIKEYGWYEFATTIEEDETLPDQTKICILCKAIRLDRRY